MVWRWSASLGYWVTIGICSAPLAPLEAHGDLRSTDRGYRRPRARYCVRRYPGYWGGMVTGNRTMGRGCWHRHHKTPIINIRQMDAAPATGSDANWCLVAEQPMVLVDAVRGQGARVDASLPDRSITGVPIYKTGVWATRAPIDAQKDCYFYGLEKRTARQSSEVHDPPGTIKIKLPTLRAYQVSSPCRIIHRQYRHIC